MWSRGSACGSEGRGRHVTRRALHQGRRPIGEARTVNRDNPIYVYMYVCIYIYILYTYTYMYMYILIKATSINWCCFYYFVRNRLVALLEALCALYIYTCILCALYIYTYIHTCIYTFIYMLIYIYIPWSHVCQILAIRNWKIMGSYKL